MSIILHVWGIDCNHTANVLLSLSTWLAVVKRRWSVLLEATMYTKLALRAAAFGEELVCAKEATNAADGNERTNHHWTLTKKDF